MTLNAISSQFGKGGSHLTDGGLKGILTEVQGLTVNVVTGAGSGVKMNLAALRTEDTLVSVLELVGAGTTVTDVVDRTSIATIAETKATGTVTCASVANNDTATVNAKVYTFKTTLTDLENEVGGSAYEVLIGASDTASAANLAAAINVRDGATVSATSALGVVTVKSVADGTTGNAYTLVSSNGTRLAVSGAGTLTGGTATGGLSVSTSTATSKLVVVWMNKQ
jgi:phage tail sheath gpL-like